MSKFVVYFLTCAIMSIAFAPRSQPEELTEGGRCPAGMQINSTELQCCNGLLRYRHADDARETALFCCGTASFDPIQDECCDDLAGIQPFVRPLRSPRHRQPVTNWCCEPDRNGRPLSTVHCDACIDGTVYDIRASICCSDCRLFGNGCCFRRNDCPPGVATADSNVLEVSRDAGVTNCCGNVTYDTRTQRCCHNQYVIPMTSSIGDVTHCYAGAPHGYVNTSTALCCAGVVHASVSVGADVTTCCGYLLQPVDMRCCLNDSTSGQLYNASLHQCCGGVLLPVNAQCCANKWPMNSTSICCRKSGPIRAFGDATRCCEGRRGRLRAPYNHRTQVCRNGRVTALVQCGEHSYNPRTQLCCQGVIHRKRTGHRCCQPGTKTFNPDTQTCCNGHVFDNKPQTSFRCVNGRPRCPRRAQRLCGNSTCYLPHRQICCRDSSGRSAIHWRRRHGGRAGGDERCCGLTLCKRRRQSAARHRPCRVRRYNGRERICSQGDVCVDLLCPSQRSEALGAAMTQFSQLCAGAKHVVRGTLNGVFADDDDGRVLTVEFNHLRLHACGAWNSTLAHALRHNDVTMTLHTTLNCSTNYIRPVDRFMQYFIAIRRPFTFTDHNYNLQRADKVIRTNRRSTHPVDSYGQFTPTALTKLDSTQLLS